MRRPYIHPLAERSRSHAGWSGAFRPFGSAQGAEVSREGPVGRRAQARRPALRQAQGPPPVESTRWLSGVEATRVAQGVEWDDGRAEANSRARRGPTRRRRPRPLPELVEGNGRKAPEGHAPNIISSKV